MSSTKAKDAFSKEYIKVVLRHAYIDMNYLLQEGFDTNVNDCEIDGVKETLEEIRTVLADDPKFQAYIEETS